MKNQKMIDNALLKLKKDNQEDELIKYKFKPNLNINRS
jgi:hypothetical protein